MVQEQASYPVTVRGELTKPPGRGWWLLKWLLGIPHYIILFFLWIAFVVVCIIAFFAILFTGKYPKGLFEFNTGVLRWTWRVSFYSYYALGTDKYPPFSGSKCYGCMRIELKFRQVCQVVLYIYAVAKSSFALA